MDWNRNNKIHRGKMRGVSIKNIARHTVSKCCLTVILQSLHHLCSRLLVRVERPGFIYMGNRLNEVKFFPDQFLLALVTNDLKPDRAANCTPRRIQRVREAAQ
jgi:hypothetical protein